ncbi:MAG: glycosyltransferase [Phycisphaerae bacterium]
MLEARPASAPRSRPRRRDARRPIRVLHVVPALAGGGMERALIRLIQCTTRSAGRRAPSLIHGVCVLKGAEPALLEQCAAHARVWVFEAGRHGRVPAWLCWWRLRKVFRRFRPEVVHARGTGAWFDAVMAGRTLPGTRLVLSFHGKERLGPPGRRRQWINRWAASRADALLTVSRESAGQLRRDYRLPADKVAVLHNGVDTERFRPPEKDEARRIRARLGLGPRDRVVACVANLLPIKAVDVLLRAWSQVSAGDPGARLLLIGDGPLRPSLEDFARATGIASSVRFLGAREDVPELLRTADLSVLPSRYEACSNAILEALATGLPAIACDVGGNRELIVPRSTGWLVEPDSPARLADVLTCALLDDPARRRMGAQARRTAVESFGLSAWAARYVRLYRSLAGKSPGPRGRREGPACAE